jgi:hypothetical protein
MNATRDRSDVDSVALVPAAELDQTTNRATASNAMPTLSVFLTLKVANGRRLEGTGHSMGKS